jgi:hypothetical protein
MKRAERLAAVARGFGVTLATRAVCREHQAPLHALDRWCYERPPVSLMLGPRGGGKSFLSAFATHWDSLVHPRFGTRILGGSMSQSQQIYTALRWFRSVPGNAEVFDSLTAERARYVTGSDVAVLSATEKAVRGPHVPSLRLDEVDEIDPEIREAAMGMCLGRHGLPASVTMTSTWHRLGGPMEGLIERASGGDFPLFAFCVFDILETCPDERSGKHLEHCPACPLRSWCHADADEHAGVPKAKRSMGHYPIESLLQKVVTVSRRVFEADYLCLGPKADGVWFSRFDGARHVTTAAEYDPAQPVTVAIDSGVFTGAVLFQVHRDAAGLATVNVFADLLLEDVPAEDAARSVLTLAESYCRGRLDRRVTDPAGRARTAIGPTVLGEYQRAGLSCDCWPSTSLADSLALVESFLQAADGSIGLTIHPRCVHLIRAFQSYRRARRGGQWQDYPEDPQHPHEDLMDALRGGLVSWFPEGRRPEPRMRRIQPSRVF